MLHGRYSWRVISLINPSPILCISFNIASTFNVTRPLSFSSFLEDTNSTPLNAQLATLSLTTQPRHDLLNKAFYAVVDTLRAKARESTWTVIRSAYREISCHADSPTRDWLAKSLALQPVLPDSDSATLDQWLQGKSSLNQVRQKEGVEGRWIICKVTR